MSIFPDADLLELFTKYKVYPYDLEKLFAAMCDRYQENTEKDIYVLRKYYSVVDCLNYRGCYVELYFPEIILFIPIQHVYACIFGQFQFTYEYINLPIRLFNITQLKKFNRNIAIAFIEDLCNYAIKMENESIMITGGLNCDKNERIQVFFELQKLKDIC